MSPASFREPVQRVLERLSLVNLPASLNPQIGPDYSPVGQIYFYTLQSTDPRYDIMALKSYQDCGWYSSN